MAIPCSKSEPPRRYYPMKIKTGFDAVRMMREIRDEISREIIDMSYEEEKRYIQEQLRLQDHLAQERKRTA